MSPIGAPPPAPPVLADTTDPRYRPRAGRRPPLPGPRQPPRPSRPILTAPFVPLAEFPHASEAWLIEQWRRARGTGDHARARAHAEFLIGANQSLVRRLTARYRLSRLQRDDLHQASNVGLLQAMDRFDARRGRFPSYASYWIRKEVQRTLAAGEFAIPLPAHLPGRTVALRSLGEDADAGRANRLGLGRGTVGSLLAVLEADRSAAETEPVQSGELSPVEAEAEERDSARLVRDEIERLPVELRRVVELVFGLGRHRTHSARAAAQALGVSDFTVRARLARALGLLRARLTDLS